MMPTYHRVRDGQQVSERDAFDERGTLRDGFTMRTKVMLRDGAPVVGLTDEQRCDLIDKYSATISNAWRNPAPEADPPAARDAASIPDAYDRYLYRLENAWRS